MITRLLRFLGVTLDGPDVVIVPTDQWHRMHEERRQLSKEGEELRWRVKKLEGQLAAMKQGRAS